MQTVIIIIHLLIGVVVGVVLLQRSEGGNRHGNRRWRRWWARWLHDGAGIGQCADPGERLFSLQPTRNQPEPSRSLQAQSPPTTVFDVPGA